MGALSAGCACSVSDSGDGSVISVSTTEFAPVEEFVTNCEYVVLETSDSCIMSGKLMFHTSDKYIVAYSEDSGIDVFSREGKHLNHFSNRGLGYGEAIMVLDFYISGDELVCMPFLQHNLLVYDILTGEFLREIHLPDNYFYACPINDDLVALSPLYSNYSLWNFTVLNIETNDTIANYVPYKELSMYQLGYDFNTFVGQGEGCVYAVLPFDYNIYCITADTCRTMLRYEFNTAEQIEKFDIDTIKLADMNERYLHKGVVRWLGDYCTSESGAHYQQFNLLCEHEVLPFLCKFDGKSSKSETLRIGAEVFDKFPFLAKKPFEVKEGYYICAMEASQVLNREKSLNSDTFAKLGVTEDSNPVIFFYKLK